MGEENGETVISSGVYVRMRGAGRSITEDQVREALGKYGALTDKTVINLRRAYVIAHFEEDGAAQKLLGEGKLKLEEDKSFDVEALKQGGGEPKSTTTNGGEKKQPKKKSTKSKKGGNKENGASASNNKKDDAARDRSLYVSGLGEEFDKDELRKFFETFGPVQSLSVRKKKSKPKNGTESVSCHAFVTFEDASTANATLEKSSETNGLQWSSMTLTIQKRKEQAVKKAAPAAATNGAKKAKKAPAAPKKKEAPVKKTIYVSNLKLDVTEDKLKELFAKYGAIKGVSIRQRDAFASVEFSSEEEAKKAQAGAKETPITSNGNTLTVSPFKSGRKVNQKQKCAIHLSGFQDKTPTEDELTELFGAFGEIKSFNIRPKRTYGFVEFNDFDSAKTVLDEATSGELGKHIPSADDASLVVELSDSSRSRQPRRPRLSNNNNNDEIAKKQ